MFYAVCTSCPFLRAYSRDARPAVLPSVCPACGAELQVHLEAGRFPPAYVSRVSLELFQTPELQGRHEIRR